VGSPGLIPGIKVPFFWKFSPILSGLYCTYEKNTVKILIKTMYIERPIGAVKVKLFNIQSRD
jgi:hypothetical protein